MIREYVEGHKLNQKKIVPSPIRENSQLYWICGVIRCDGVNKVFCGWCPLTESGAKDKAQEEFDKYLDQRCVCMAPENPEGLNPPCPVHAEVKG